MSKERDRTMEIKLGRTYTDSLHGISGIATVYSQYITGCNRVCLERVGEDGLIIEYWVDTTRLDGVQLPEGDNKPGGPGKVAPSRIPPHR